jgi:predicted ATPase with chaperone activity
VSVVYRDDPYREEGGFASDDDLVRTFGQALGGLPKGPDGPAAPAAVEEPDAALLALVPPQPRTLPDTGLSRAFLIELALKTIHYTGQPSANHITERMCLPPAIVLDLLSMLADDHLCEVVSSSNAMAGNYRYRLTSNGIDRVKDALERSRYAGPAPVTIEQYIEVMEQQRAVRPHPSRESIEAALSELVLAPEVSDNLARSLHSGRCTLLYGPSGNGKTMVLEAFARHLEGTVLVPYAIYAQGQIIRVFDSSTHVPAFAASTTTLPQAGADETWGSPRPDDRWIVVRRPAVMVGGELSAESLELAFDPVSRFYQAPPHLKAQGGLLIVDDFGRQRIRPEDLLNRWLTPLEREWETLTFQTGEKISVPFDLHLLFATNLKVELLLDQPFLRRILYKVEIPNPGPDEFHEILRRVCDERGVAVSEEALDHVVRRLYEGGQRPRASHARDILDIVIESASYDQQEPALTPEAFERAFRLFLPGGMAEVPDSPTYQD